MKINLVQVIISIYGVYYIYLSQGVPDNEHVTEIPYC